MGDEVEHLKAEMAAMQRRVALAEAKQRSAEDKLSFRLKLKSSLLEAEERASKIKTVDICFVIDCTQSMQPYITSVRKKIEDIAATLLKKLGPGASLRYGFVAYRDFEDEDHPEVLPFTSDLCEVKGFLTELQAVGGGDWCEDVLGGLEAAVRLEWRGTVRQLFLISQTPNHGSNFHSHAEGSGHFMGSVRLFNYDDHLGVDQHLQHTQALMAQLRGKDIYFNCLEISGCTAQMFEVFASKYDSKKDGLTLKVLPMTSSPDSILSSVVRGSIGSITASVQKLSQATLAAGIECALLEQEIDPGDIDWDHMEGWRSLDVEMVSYEVGSGSKQVLFSSPDECVTVSTVRHRVRLALRPFSKGAMRYAFAMFDEKTGAKLVAKIYALSDEKYRSEEVLTGDLRSQAFARYFADAFNKRFQGSPLQCVQTQLVRIIEGSASKTRVTLMCAEPFIPGNYRKQTNNASFMSETSKVAQAFSHFSHDFSGGEMMVTDIQGVGTTLTDPQIHSKRGSELFGRGNFGAQGFDAFFMMHKCSDLCRDLRLKPNPAQMDLDLSDFANGPPQPGHLSAFEVRSGAQRALVNKSKRALLGSICLQSCGPSNRATVVEVTRRTLVYAPADDGDVPSRSEGSTATLAHRLAAQDQTGRRDWMGKAQQIIKARASRGVRYVGEVEVKPGFVLESVNGYNVLDSDWFAILRCLSRYYDDSDSTRSPSMVFVKGHGTFIPPPSRPQIEPKTISSIPEAEAAPEAEQLQWVCGGKCGRMVCRDATSSRYSKARGLPKEVFCRECSVKVHRSWRAKKCGASECGAWVHYYEFVLQVQASPEPKFCKACDELSQGGWHVIEAVDDGVRLKKCERCRQTQLRIEVVPSGEGQVPDLCDACRDAGESHSDLDKQGDTTDGEDYAAEQGYPEDAAASRAVKQGKPPPEAACVPCRECSSETACFRYTCQQSNLHVFYLCTSKKCQKTFEKKGVDYNKKCGKAGQQRLDFAQHRGSMCCMTCGHMLTASEEAVCITEG